MKRFYVRYYATFEQRKPTKVVEFDTYELAEAAQRQAIANGWTEAFACHERIKQ